MDVFKKEGVEATFFILGSSIDPRLRESNATPSDDLADEEEEKLPENPDYKANIELLKRMIDEGHDVGSHSYNHPLLIPLSDQQVAWQFSKTARLMHAATGYYPKFLRAPEGYILQLVG